MSAVISLVQNQSWMNTLHKVLWPGLHLFRLLSCCHLPQLGSSWGLVGNNLECLIKGPRSDLQPKASPWRGASPSTGGFQAGAAEESSFCLRWLYILSLWMSKKLDLPHWGCGQVMMKSSCLKDPSSNAACTLLLLIRNTMQTLILFCSAEKSSLFFKECDKNGLWLKLHTWGWISDSSKLSSVTQIMSEVQPSGNGCTACLGKCKHRRKGEKEGLFSHCADSLLGCSCCIWRAGWKVTRCWQVRWVLKWAGRAELSLTCWGWKPHMAAEGLRGFSALLLPLECTTGPFCSTLNLACVQQLWLCPKPWTPTDPCAFPGQGASDISMEHPARMPLPGHTCGLSHSTYLCFSGNYFTLIRVLSHTQTVTAHHSRSQTVNILQI